MLGFILLAAQTDKSIKMHAHDSVFRPFFITFSLLAVKKAYQRMCVCSFTLFLSLSVCAALEIQARRRHDVF